MSPAAALLLSMAALASAADISFSSRLIHRFSEEAKALRIVGHHNCCWPPRRSLYYYHMLIEGDLQRLKMKLIPNYKYLFPSQGSKTLSLGNDFGWLHYIWIDIGTPRVSFLVALDSGSDLLWVPCDCVQCAPLSSSYYSSLDRDLSEYNPTFSSTSKHISCSHELCSLGSSCTSPKQPCPYNIDYDTDDTSSSGLLIEDVLHLASDADDTKNNSVQASVILGCGMKQSGGYLDRVAPDGLLGLGLSGISVPSFLAKVGLVPNSFSMCFDEDDSGRIYFGDQGPAIQQSTPFLTLDGNYTTYVVGVEACCVGNACLKLTNFRGLVDCGTSFTFLPAEIYETVAREFDRQVNASISNFEGYPWKYCYKSSAQDSPKIPSIKLMFPLNSTFVVHNPVFMIYGIEGVIGFCLAIQPADGDLGIIGQNFMTGYRVVFDRENLKLGWSNSKCGDLNASNGTPLNPFPNEQQSNSGGNAVSPAVAGRAPSKPSSASPQLISSDFCLLKLLPLLLFLHLAFAL